MTDVTTERQLLFAPAYTFFTVRDQESPGGVDVSPALEQAGRHVAGCGGRELYIRCAQDQLQVLATLRATRCPPQVPDPQFESSAVFTLDCPSGVLQMGDVTGWAEGGIALPTGPGRYRVRVLHHGRDEARQRLRLVKEYTGDLSIPQLEHEFDRYAGIEQYVIEIWPDEPSSATA